MDVPGTENSETEPTNWLWVKAGLLSFWSRTTISMVVGFSSLSPLGDSAKAFSYTHTYKQTNTQALVSLLWHEASQATEEERLLLECSACCSSSSPQLRSTRIGSLRWLVLVKTNLSILCSEGGEDHCQGLRQGRQGQVTYERGTLHPFHQSDAS